MMRKKGVAVCIRNNKGEVLLLKRGVGHRYGHTQGEWEQCGGGVDNGESVEQAAVREVKEELGCEVRLGKELLHDDFEGMGDEVVWEVKVFEGKLVGKPRIMEPKKCVELKWFEKEELKSV